MTTRRIMATGLAAGAAALLSSCGTIIYPDRVHQKNRGDLDPSVVILNGIGLFFFIIPGVIAFAVDFSTGAIYLPKNKTTRGSERTIFDDLSMISPDREKLTQQDIEEVIAKAAGVEINLLDRNVSVMELDHISRFPLASL